MGKWSETTVWVADRINKQAILKSFVNTHISRKIKNDWCQRCGCKYYLEYKHMIRW